MLIWLKCNGNIVNIKFEPCKNFKWQNNQTEIKNYFTWWNFLSATPQAPCSRRSALYYAREVLKNKILYPIGTVYWHHFPHHFDFFVLFRLQYENYKTIYIGCLYVIVRCLKPFFCDFLLSIHGTEEHRRLVLDWCPKPSLFTPVRNHLKFALQCAPLVGCGQRMLV